MNPELIKKMQKVTEKMEVLYNKMLELNKELIVNSKNAIEESSKKYSMAMALLDRLPKCITSKYYKVLERNCLTVKELIYSYNTTQVVMCRHEIHYVLHLFHAKKKGALKQPEVIITLANISTLTGRTHSMALNSIKVIKNEMETRPTYADEFGSFIKSLDKKADHK